MNNKRLIACMILVMALLMTVPLFAQSPRQPTSSDGKTTFTNIATTGLDATGVPSYIEMMSTDGSTRYYLFVDSNGNLRIASEIACGYQASPQTTTWLAANPDGAVGVPVGEQTK